MQFRIIYRRHDAINVEQRKTSRIESRIVSAPNEQLAQSTVVRDRHNEVLAVDEWTPALERRVEKIRVDVILEDW